MIAIDGKTMRGARHPAGTPHLVVALRDLLDTMDITGAVITADAMHCQRETAGHITDAGGHYLLTFEDNQRALRDKLKALPWNQVPSTSTVTTSHGCSVRRTVKTVQAPGWVDFPAPRR